MQNNESGAAGRDLNVSQEEDHETLEQLSQRESSCIDLTRVGVSFSNMRARIQPPPSSSSQLNESTVNMVTRNNDISSLTEVEPNHNLDGNNHDLGSIHSSASLTVESSALCTFDHHIAQMINFGVDIKISNWIPTLLTAKDELDCLLQEDGPYWIKDMIERKDIIHREYYDRDFGGRSCNSDTRFESSIDTGFVSINANEVIRMLSDSKVRLEVFSSILTQSIVIHEYVGEAISPYQIGPIQLVYEQMHLHSPFIAPRDVCYLRFCEKIDNKTWVIVEVSCNPTSSQNMHLPSHESRTWRLPSGYLIKQFLPTLTKIVWLEHVQVDDNNVVTPPLFREIVLRGLSFEAKRFIRTLVRHTFRVRCHNMNHTFFGFRHCGIILNMAPKERSVITDISGRMVKTFCANLVMKNKTDLPNLSNNDIKISFWKTNNGFLINATANFWISLPFKQVIDFFNDVKLRSQWDVLCNKQDVNQIGTIFYGTVQDNSIVLIEVPVIPSKPNIMVIQETILDPLGGMVVYAPIEINHFQRVLDQANISPGCSSSSSSSSSSLLPRPCDIELIPSGFIIYNDGRPDIEGATSNPIKSYIGMNNGSLVTASFQVLIPEATSFTRIDTTLADSLHSQVNSTVQNIKNALNFRHRHE